MASGPAGASPLSVRYGGFWIRFGARFIDGLIFTVPILIVAAVVIPNLTRSQAQGGGVSNPLIEAFGLVGFLLVSFVAGGAYEILMLKYRSATLGKIACGLKVIRSDGRSLGWGVCFGRFFMWNVVTSGVPYLNMILMPVTAIVLGVDREKRALHDRVCDTRVIYK
jgi:uncharacterized RDD family membrane protein YckC